jgi:hypothetical protein
MLAHQMVASSYLFDGGYMASFDDLMTDRIIVKRQDGSESPELNAVVSRNGIHTDYSGLIEAGDLIIRKMSNGGQETYKVIDPGFHEPFHSFPAHYQMEVVNLSRAQFDREVSQITYNINGDNNRINNNSTDNSNNWSHRSEAFKLYDRLQNEVLAQPLLDEPEFYAAALTAIRQQLEAEKPNKKMIEKMIGMLPHAANVATIGSLLLGLLP